MYPEKNQQQDTLGVACENAPLGERGYARAESPYRPSIQERVHTARVYGAHAVERLQAAERIAMILDKYPEFGELLDLIERL